MLTIENFGNLRIIEEYLLNKFDKNPKRKHDKGHFFERVVQLIPFIYIRFNMLNKLLQRIQIHILIFYKTIYREILFGKGFSTPLNQINKLQLR